MSGRRSRISARPNLGRVSRGDASKSQPSEDSTTKTSSTNLETASTASPPGVEKATRAEHDTTQESGHVAMVTMKTTTGVVREVTAEATKEVTKDLLPLTDSMENKPEDPKIAPGKPSAEKAITRRSKIQARPMITRKPRQSAVVPAKTDHTDSTPAVVKPPQYVESATEGTAEPEASSVSDSKVVATPRIVVEDTSDDRMEVSADINVTSSVSTESTSDSAYSESKRGDSEPEQTKIRQFKPKTKPNVLEAGRARMRRLSESVEMSSHLVSPSARRSRHPSTPGDRTESVVKVDPIRPTSAAVKAVTFQPNRGPEYLQNALDNAKKRRHSKGEAEIDQDILEQEQADFLAAETLPEVPKHKKPRKVRRVILSDKAPDTSKMTIKELIYYQPTSNPLPQREEMQNAPSRRKSAESTTSHTSNDDSAEKPANPDDMEPSASSSAELAPQLMIGEDGQIIINQQSLTVETETPTRPITYEDVTVDRDGEGATYASFRSNRNIKYWTDVETAQFYKALNCVGTDFSLMCQLFPKRTRMELKRKFKKEEKSALGRVQLAMEGKLNFEADPFPEYNKQMEREDKKQQMGDKRKKRGGAKVRTYYDVGDEEEHRQSMAGKRLKGHGGKNKKNGAAEEMITYEDCSNEATSQPNDTAPRQMLSLRFQCTELVPPANQIVFEAENAFNDVPSSQLANQLELETDQLSNDTSSSQLANDTYSSQLANQMEIENESAHPNTPLTSQLTNQMVIETERAPPDTHLTSQLTNQTVIETDNLPNGMPSISPLVDQACTLANQMLPPSTSISTTSTNSSADDSSKSAPVKPTALRPMPSISTMFHQSAEINKKITDLILSSRTPVPRRRQPPTTPRNTTAGIVEEDIILSPLYNLENGDSIMVRTQKLPGSDKKVHHLYLYTPPRTDSSGNRTTPILNPINITNQQANMPATPTNAPTIPTAGSSGEAPIFAVRSPAVTVTAINLGCNKPPAATVGMAQPLDLSKTSPVVSRLIKPPAKSHPSRIIMPGESMVETMPKVPTRKLTVTQGPSPTIYVSEEKILSFPDL